MGFLDNSSTTVDAILTKKGRELLARGRNEFKITKFALADDEIDYTLWDVTNPNGTNYYGAVIENMPILEPVADETQAMKYKLVTLPKETSRLPILDVAVSTLAFSQGGGNGELLQPGTLNSTDSEQGYTFHSKTDTEVILASYDCWGKNCVKKFNGMWAFGILDRKNKHFTAETIQKEVSIKGHNISLATIYNCLNKFVNVGLLKQIDQQGEVTIFDTNVSHHHHFLNQNNI